MPCKSELLHVRFGNTGTKMINTTSNILTWGLRTPWKGATTHCGAMGHGSTRHEAMSPRLTVVDRRMVLG
jgi:hypothetical protein